jgi:hypothetical protein
MSSLRHFPNRYASIDDCPERFRNPLKRAINPARNIYDIIYSPGFVSSNVSVPASVFCTTDQEWFIASEAKRKSEGIGLACATYANTLLIGLIDILLYGQLRIDYASLEQSQSSVCFFNTVYEEIYRNAIQRMLGLMDGIKEPPAEKDQKVKKYLETWPHKFRNLAWDCLPPGSNILDALHWPTILGIFGQELGPAAALFFTDRHLVSLANERSRSWIVKKEEVNFGTIVTYFPLSRLGGFQIQKRTRFHVLELEARTSHGAGCFRLRFPPEYHDRVVQLVGNAAKEPLPKRL